jgi:hypothetical protein
MSSSAQSGLSKKFNLDTSILGEGSAASVELSATTASDVQQAVLGNSPFPDRRIDLAGVALQAEAGKDIRFSAKKGMVSFHASGGAHARLAVLDKGDEVLDCLALKDAAKAGLVLKDQPGVRYLLLLAGYELEGKVDGSHPIGLLGSVTFGVEAKRDQLYAVIHRFPRERGASDAIGATVASFRPPRHVSSAGDLHAGTLLVAEVEGSVAVSVAAQLGYDFSFVREASALGLTGDIGLKLDVGLKATLGLEASGRYLVALDRESLDANSALARLRLFKMNKKGWNFGLNLSASVQGAPDILPASVDDLVKAVFGVHGQQVVKDLLLIEKWTDPASDLSDTVAGLAKDTGLELLRKTTGIDPAQKFNEARSVLLGALKQWDSLPDRVSGALWSLLESGGLHGQERQALEASLGLLAGTSGEERRKEMQRLLEAAGIEAAPIGQILVATGDLGLLNLLDRLPEVQSVAGSVLGVLNGGVIEKLQEFAGEKLELDQIRNAVTVTDFARIEGWLVNRLSTFLDRKLRFEDLDEIKNAINAVIVKRQEIYEKARNALARRYDFSLAYAYQKSAERTALIDATFDLHQPEAAGLMKEVLQESRLDNLLVKPVRGVTLHEGVLTHEITCRSSVEVNIPYYNFRSDRLNRSLASVRAVEDGGRVMLYELDAKDEVAVRNRMKSQLALAAAIPLAEGGAVRVHSAASATWAYQYRMARENMRRVELERQAAPLIATYFPEHFGAGGPSSFSTWLTDLDRRVEEELGRPTDDFGDVLLSLEVTVPASAVYSWLVKRDEQDLRAATMTVSRRLQAGLKDLIPFHYFQDVSRLRQNLPAAALLVYAAIPLSTNIRIAGDTVRLNADLFDNKEKRVHWDWRDPDKRRRMVSLAPTQSRLAVLITAARERLLAAGQLSEAEFFKPEELGDFITSSNWDDLDGHLGGLLRLEDIVVTGAAEAMKEIQGFHKDKATLPSKAIARLAEFGAEVTKTFNERLASRYGSESLRPLGSMLFLEASRTLDPALSTTRPGALLSLTVLKEERAFSLPKFLEGESPKKEDIAVAQRLVSTP